MTSTEILTLAKFAALPIGGLAKAVGRGSRFMRNPSQWYGMGSAYHPSGVPYRRLPITQLRSVLQTRDNPEARSLVMQFLKYKKVGKLPPPHIPVLREGQPLPTWKDRTNMLQQLDQSRTGGRYW
jgi:hypothetical protein